MPSFLAFAWSFLAAVFLTPLVAMLARRFRIADDPAHAERKQHGGVVPLAGGAAIFVAIAAVLFLFEQLRLLPHILVPWRAVEGMLIGGAILVVGGLIDDRFDLRPRWQFIAPILAVCVVIASGIVVTSLRSPFGGSWSLVASTTQIGPFAFLFPAHLLTFLWILGMTYTTKILDGLDGLVAGMLTIAAVLICVVAMRPELRQPDVAVISLAIAGAFAGFLVWNFHPAKIFLGEGGSTLAGFLLGTLGVISGSKVATTLLVLGVPIMDLAHVIFSRARAGQPLFVGDRRHLHFQLLTAGLSPRSAVLFLYACALGFGIVGLIGSTGGKAVAFIVLSAFVLLLSRVVRRHAASV